MSVVNLSSAGPEVHKKTMVKVTPWEVHCWRWVLHPFAEGVGISGWDLTILGDKLFWQTGQHRHQAGRFENEQSLFYAAQITCIFEWPDRTSLVGRWDSYTLTANPSFFASQILSWAEHRVPWPEAREHLDQCGWQGVLSLGLRWISFSVVSKDFLAL